MSQGLVTSRSEAADHLKALRYECVIVDEAHRARRKNLGVGRENEGPDANNLLSFLYEVSPRTKSLLLATATPVQLHPIEAWDLLNVLAGDNEAVLGNTWSHWRRAAEALDLVVGRVSLSEQDLDRWSWIRNPLPPAGEGADFQILRRSLRMPDEAAVAPGDSWERLGEPDRARVRRLARDFGEEHNPFIRHIVRRTRDYLETTLDPETNEPYLKPVAVDLLGETDADAIRLPPYLQDAYRLAEEFCRLIGARVMGAGFLKTLLLRRLGSTMYAGSLTAEGMLGSWRDVPESDEEEEEEQLHAEEAFRTLAPQERQKLQAFVDALRANQERDPKYQVVVRCHRDRAWLGQGCIVFSQYYDSIAWLAEQLSKEFPEESIGIYAGGQRSGIRKAAEFIRTPREDLKRKVATGEIRLLLGTDAASEGLNLQRLGTLINLDLPWNPTRLEQRKGRIQRIGQTRDTVLVYNMRYKGSVEDRVHHLLSDRLESIYQLFGQVPDVLEDVWIQVALGEIEHAKQTHRRRPQA